MKKRVIALVLACSIFFTSLVEITAFAALPSTSILVTALMNGTVIPGSSFEGQLIISSTTATNAALGIIDVNDINPSYNKIIPAITIVATNDVASHTIYNLFVRNRPNDSPLILDNVSGVTLSGVTIDCQNQTTNGGERYYFAGVYVRNGSNNTITGVNVLGMQKGADSNGNSSAGILIDNSSNTTITNCLIETNTGPMPYFKTGIIIHGGSDTNISNNTIVGIPGTNIGAQNGIQVSQGVTSTVIDGNIISSFGYGGGTESAGIINFTLDTIITNNHYQNFTGDYLYMYSSEDLATVAGNTVTGQPDTPYQKTVIPLLSVDLPSTLTTFVGTNLPLPFSSLFVPGQPTIDGISWNNLASPDYSLIPSSDSFQAVFNANTAANSPYTVTASINGLDRSAKNISKNATYTIIVLDGVTISFNLNGAVGMIVPIQIETATSINTSPFKLPSTANLPMNVPRPGYTFLGWSTNPAAKSPDFTDSTLVTKDITLYAIWSAISSGSAASGTTNGNTADQAPENQTDNSPEALLKFSSDSNIIASNNQTTEVSAEPSTVRISVAPSTLTPVSTVKPMTNKEGRKLYSVLTKNSAIIYSSASKTSKSVLAVEKNQPLVSIGLPFRLKGKTELWRRIILKGQNGYILDKDLHKSSLQDTTSLSYIYENMQLARITKSSKVLNINGSEIGSIKKNSVVAVVEKKENHYKIVFGSGFAYIKPIK